jgi:hypothetical protein
VSPCLGADGGVGALAEQVLVELEVPVVRGLHSYTFRLNLSAFCVIGGAVRGCFGGVPGVERVVKGM